MFAATSARGQTQVLGVTLLFGFTAIAAGMLLVAGGGAIQGAQSDIGTERRADAMERFDGRTAVVALGESGAQTVDLPPSEAGYEVRPEAGWLRVTHRNATGSDEVVYNGTLGAVVARGEDGAELAYQGGGVWKREGDRSRVVSPPEFHYRGATVTLPVVQVRGSGAVSGDVAATVTPTATGVPVYPNASRTYDGTDDAYRNPLQEGNVTITVRSDYYRGWADYFRTRTGARVASVDPATGTITVELTAAGPVGEFDMPNHGNAIAMRGVGDGHAIDEFEVTLRPDRTDGADFGNLDWRLSATEGDRDLTIGVSSGGRPCNGAPVDVRVTYSNATTTQVWEREDAFSENGTGFSYECAGEPSLTVDLGGSSTLGYVSGPDGLSFDHGADGEPTTHSLGDDAPVGRLVDHYAALLGSDVAFEVRDRGGRGRGAAGSVDESRSFGTLHHERSGSVVRFLRVTENRVHVELD